MSRNFTTTSSARENILINAEAAVKSIIANAGARYSDPNVANNVISLESINEVDYHSTVSTVQSLTSELRASPEFMKLFSGVTDPAILEMSLESAAITLLGGTNPAGYYASVKTPQLMVPGETTINPYDGDVDFSFESFDPVTEPDYLIATAIANAQTMSQSGFDDVWFPIRVVPPGENGVSVTVTIPKIMNNVNRNADGSPLKLQKRSIIDAVIDPDLLDSNITTIVPYADPVSPGAYLAPASAVPTVNEIVNGMTVPSRPLRIGTEVDLINISNSPALLGSGIFDATESLDPVINVGTIWCELSVTSAGVTKHCIFSADISGQHGALLTQVQSGNTQDYQTTCKAAIVINPNTLVSLSGDSKAVVIAALEGVLGVAANAEFTLIATTRYSATANIETGSYLPVATNNVIEKYLNAAGVEQSLAPLSAVGVTVTITPLYHVPVARRTNSNLRSISTIIDSNAPVRYLFPVSLSPAITSWAPIGSTPTTALEGLNATARIRQSGRCVKALAYAEKILSAGKGIPAATPFIGSEYVKPTYIAVALDVTDTVASLSSKDAIPNLRGALLAAMTTTVTKGIKESGYLAGLEMDCGDISNFEVLVATDVNIAPFLWESGDVRTLGEGRSFVVSANNNKFFHDKIYMSFRRKVRGENPHGLDFGRLLYTPPLTVSAPIGRNGRTTLELHTIPRVNAYVTLPVLMVITVTGIDQVFSPH